MGMSKLLDDLLGRVAALVPAMQRRAPGLDADPSFPYKDFDELRAAGLLMATLPVESGGAGLGEGREGANLCRLLALLGEGNLAVARLFEAHVNALQLVMRYGSWTLIQAVTSDAAAGHLFGLWVTDPATGGVELMPDQRLQGKKVFCSGAGAVTRALITARTPGGTQMMIVSPGAPLADSGIHLAGMRAAVTGAVDFSGMQIEDWQHLGAAGDYLAEPVFSAGAWRGSAAAYGGLRALTELHRREILQRGRSENPHQAARFGQLVIASETARLWLGRVAQRACLEDGSPEEIVAYVNLGRIAIEAACLDALRLTQRSLGLSAFMAGSAAERIARDLAVFLRQPAPDETLEKGAQFYFTHEPPA
jgi:alkylation response protein AidB-like acyl-CoA dehydrogenase